MPRWLINSFAFLLVTLLVAGPVLFAARQQNQVRNFRVVKDEVLYRSGQMSLEGLKRIVHEYGIRTVVSLRDKSHSGPNSPDEAEENYCAAQEIYFLRLPPQRWQAENWDDAAPVEENVQAFRDIIANPNHFPILIHCFAGIHRTGAYCAIFHMEQDHWTNDQAIADLEASGYADIESDVLGYLQHYRPSWKRKPE
ncbi:MAG: fused DSP-PTPase phosphatase/NAD kinase-like protein [Gemmataceae bacterium]